MLLHLSSRGKNWWCCVRTVPLFLVMDDGMLCRWTTLCKLLVLRVCMTIEGVKQDEVATWRTERMTVAAAVREPLAENMLFVVHTVQL